MELLKTQLNEDTLILGFCGHIDSSNSPELEEAINAARAEAPGKAVIIDSEELEYISSAGLRVILRLKKDCPDLKVINVRPEVYEVLDMTGFTEMMEIRKGFRKMSVAGCELIGQGANGKVYRIDPDTIVKVYYDMDALSDIERERELARTALILGIPTAIPYDIVKAEEGYGSVFELLNSKTFAKILIEEPERQDEIIRMDVDLLKKIHATEIDPATMPDMKDVALDWAHFLKEYLPEETYTKLCKLIEDVPDVHHMLHGDYHLKNVMLQDGEPMLIDMDTLCYGHPIFEFASIFNAYQGFSELDHQVIVDFLGITNAKGKEIWEAILHLYFEGKSEEEITAIADKARLIGYTRIMRRLIRRKGLENEQGRKEIENCKQHIIELSKNIDTLQF